MKHSPAPWTEFRDDDSHDIISADGTHIARMEPRNGSEPQSEQDADACLIAAAPDLLKAVHQAAAALDMAINSSDMEGAIYNADQTLIALRAVLTNHHLDEERT